MKRMLTLMLGIVSLLLASAESPQRIQVTKTDHADLAPGGTLRLKNSTGEVTIEGWDQPGVEITTTKSIRQGISAAEKAQASRILAAVKISVARQGDELVVTTDFPRHRRFLPRPSVGARDFDLEYLIKVPRNAKLIVDHDAGELNFDGLTGDIHATMIQGAILVRTPQAAAYDVDAKSRIGAVTSDLPGTDSRRHFGHAFIGNEAKQAAHKLYLRDGYGDIMILRTQRAPAPAITAQ